MPKKKNYGGQDQEFIPAGNGDASGEYADDSGNNRHFVSFAKPIDNEKEKSEDLKPKIENKEDYVVKVKTTFFDRAKLTEKQKEGVIEFLDKANPEPLKTIDEFLNIKNISYNIEGKSRACYNKNKEIIFFGDSTFAKEGENWRTPGDTFFHEHAHAIDFSTIRGDSYSANYIDEEFGLTLNESIVLEIGRASCRERV